MGGVRSPKRVLVGEGERRTRKTHGAPTEDIINIPRDLRMPVSLSSTASISFVRNGAQSPFLYCKQPPFFPLWLRRPPAPDALKLLVLFPSRLAGRYLPVLEHSTALVV